MGLQRVCFTGVGSSSPGTTKFGVWDMIGSLIFPLWVLFSLPGCRSFGEGDVPEDGLPVSQIKARFLCVVCDV